MTLDMEFDELQEPFSMEFDEVLPGTSLSPLAVQYAPQVQSKEKQKIARDNINAMENGKANTDLNMDGYRVCNIDSLIFGRDRPDLSIVPIPDGFSFTAFNNPARLSQIADGVNDNDAASVGQVKSIGKQYGLPHIYSEQSDPVALRDLESGPYVLDGIFTYFLPATRLVKFDPPQMAMVQKFDDHTEIICFMPKGNRINYLWIDDKSNTLTAVKLSEVESIANRATEIDETADDEHYPTAKAVLDYVKNNSSSVVEDDIVTDEKYFDIDYDGVVSLKPEYQADGEKKAELPEIIIIPDVIGNTAVTAFAESMFDQNLRVKSITIPSYIRTLPKKFANKTYNLIEINGTENVETICQAAFQRSSIRKAMFPKLRNFDGAGQFNSCPFLTIADIGSVTAIPLSCFANDDSLSLVMGGANVKTIGDKSFFSTRSLKNLPIVSNATSIGKETFVLSRVNYDWWTFKTSSGCTFGENATPAHFNPSQWWANCTYTACENPLGSTFHQHNPEWDTTTILNASNTYGDGCVVVSAAHIYSALTGVKFDSPQYFVENIVGGIDDGRLLAPIKGTTYQGDDIATWLTALGLKCEKLTDGYNSANLQKVYDALKDGALIFTGVYSGPLTGHAGVIFGVAENGEVLTLDSCPTSYIVGVYEAKTFQQPISSLATAGQGIIIVKKE